MEAYEHIKGFMTADDVRRFCPYREIGAEAGDLVFLRGGRLLHRGVTLHEDGERILLVYAYDEVDKRRSAIRDWIATRLNY